jgi:hypothetical protein
MSPYMKASEAAEYLCFAHVDCLYAAIKAGLRNAEGRTIPFVRRGRVLLFDRSEIEAWLRPRSGALKLASR